jgi:hypothetical protein
VLALKAVLARVQASKNGSDDGLIKCPPIEKLETSKQPIIETPGIFEMPTCFAQFLNKNSPDSKHDDALKVFEDFGNIGKRGYRNDAGTPPRPTKAARVHEPMTTSKKPYVNTMLSIIPLNPTSKKRKTQTLALRARLSKAKKDEKKAQGKPKAAKKDAKKQKKDGEDPKVPKDADKIIHKPQLCVSKGPNVRVELCAIGLDKKRVYVFGSTKNAYGENLEKHAEALKQFIEDSMDITKADVLTFLKTLQEKEPK